MGSATPGPWEWDETRKEIRAPSAEEYGRDWSADYDDDGNVIRNYRVIVQTDGGCYPPRAEDARLIAAAPDLLAALKTLIEAHDEDGVPRESEIAAARAAIMKAEGAPTGRATAKEGT